MQLRRILFILIPLLILTGCTPREEPEIYHPRVVMRINVTATVDGETIERTYTSQDKMRVLLNYLRLLHPISVTTLEPDSFRSDNYEIRLTLSDGSITVYRQIYDEYLQKNDGPWKTIDTVQGSMLHPLLTAMASDTE